MTELHFKGKEFVYNHHLAVPHRPIVPDAAKSIGTPDLLGNLIIQGDNLHALKSLLPIHAGKVDCIFIDPPYNTGNEGWCYNDRVNAPIIKEWLEENPVGAEDGLRHDKWCAMMWPRLKLLHELMSDDGVMIVHIDDNELHHLCNLLNEIFGEENFVATIAVASNLKGNQDQFGFAGCHEYVVLFAKDRFNCTISEFSLGSEESQKWQKDEFGPYKIGAGLKATGADGSRSNRENLFFPIYVSKSDEVSLTKPKDNNLWEEILPITDGQEMRWRWGREKFENELHNVIVKRGKSGTALYKKQRPKDSETPSKKAKSIFYKPEYSTSTAASELKEIFGTKIFNTPKPLNLLKDFVEICSKKDSIILDSFAGSGTTAHAVLQANIKDGGSRKFILVEMEEDIANDITAERMRRVIKGYQTNLQKTDVLFETDDPARTQLNIDLATSTSKSKHTKTQIEEKDGKSVVTSTTNYRLNQKGLSGTFTYCTLGDAIEIDKILKGENLPTYEDLAPVLFHMASNQRIDIKKCRPDDFFVGASLNETVWMIYKPDLNWLKSDEAALTLSRAKTIFQTNPARRHLVFAPARFVGEKVLREAGLNVAYVPFPDALYRLVRKSEND